MPPIVEQALDALRGLGSPEEMRERAERGVAPATRPRTNVHIHLPPNFSAFESVEQAVDLAAAQGVGVLGVSNYYDYRVYGDFVTRARRHGIFPLFGLETIVLIDDLVRDGVLINDPGNPGKMYLCGKGITRFADLTPEADRLLGIIRDNDAKRMADMIDRMTAIFAAGGVETDLDERAVIDMIVARHDCARDSVTIQERHIAQAFQEQLARLVPANDLARRLDEIFGVQSGIDPANHVAVQNAIRTHLMKSGKPAFVAESFIDFDEARRLILELGGIPCYPTLADGASPICAYEDPVDQLIDQLKAANLHMAEFIPIRNKPDVLTRYVKAMRAAGLAVVGGTEHNTLDLIGIEPTCVGCEPVPDEIKEIFWEGVCVTAAHQFLTLHGQYGFVDAEGKPNPEYDDAEARIAAFARLGAAVIQTYFESNK